MNVYIRKIGTREIVHAIPISSPPSDRFHERMMIGLLTNMDTEHFYADDSEVKTREQLAEEVSKALPAAALVTP